MADPMTFPDEPATSALNWLMLSERGTKGGEWRTRCIVRADAFARLEQARQQGRVADALERMAAAAERLFDDTEGGT